MTGKDKRKNFNALILAAGQGKRLRPLTENTPKCMLEIFGKPIIYFQIKSLLRNNIKNITIVTGFNEDKIINYLNSNFPEANFTFVKNKKYEETKRQMTNNVKMSKMSKSLRIGLGTF